MSNDSVSGVICYDDAQKRVLFIAQLSVYNRTFSIQSINQSIFIDTFDLFGFNASMKLCEIVDC
jgi:hypothetical protein